MEEQTLGIKLLDDFIKLHNQDFELRCVDYLGINISSVLNGEMTFKIYYSNKASRQGTHPLIKFLEKNGMIRYVTMVHDRKNQSRARYDVGLRNRSDKNMQAVFEWLSKNTKMFEQYSSEILKLSQMKITGKEGYNSAGLYFLGFISENDEIKTLKCHYFNRMCENPDILHKNIKYADEYYLSFLGKSEVGYFDYLSALAGEILKHCGGHLWMTGADYESNDQVKYKIYIKNPKVLYEGLLETFSNPQFVTLVENIISVKQWDDEHQEFICEGFAVCKNSEDDISINFYFKQR